VRFREFERLVGKTMDTKIKQSASHYHIGDFLIKAKNTAMAKNKELTVVPTKQIEAAAETLKKLGYFDSVKKDGKNLVVTLTFKNKKPMLTNLKLISKPGLRIYQGAVELEKKRGPSVLLITTPLGIISSREAIKKRVGGEVVAEIW
jgi:small subunit ribosomal protein S8